MILSRPLGLAVAFAALAVLYALPTIAPRAVVQDLFGILTLLVLAMNWNLLAGFAGLVSVGQQAFVGIGAYAMFAAIILMGLDPLVGVLIGGVAAVTFAVPMAFFAFRLNGAYFAIGTWVVADIARLAISQWKALGGGTGTSLPKGTAKEMAFVDQIKEMLDVSPAAAADALTYWLMLSLAVAMLVAAYVFLCSRMGLGLQQFLGCHHHRVDPQRHAQVPSHAQVQQEGALEHHGLRTQAFIAAHLALRGPLQAMQHALETEQAKQQAAMAKAQLDAQIKMQELQAEMQARSQDNDTKLRIAASDAEVNASGKVKLQGVGPGGTYSSTSIVAGSAILFVVGAVAAMGASPASAASAATAAMPTPAAGSPSNASARCWRLPQPRSLPLPVRNRRPPSNWP